MVLRFIHRMQRLTTVLLSDIKSEKYSPRSVLSILSRDLISSSGDDASSFISSMVSSSVASPSDKPKHRPMSPYRLISSLIMNSPLRKWRRNETKNNPKPLIQCFTYNEISKATKDFDQGAYLRDQKI